MIRQKVGSGIEIGMGIVQREQNSNPLLLWIWLSVFLIEVAQKPNVPSSWKPCTF
jgi:hypothetical protein